MSHGEEQKTVTAKSRTDISPFCSFGDICPLAVTAGSGEGGRRGKGPQSVVFLQAESV